MKVGDLITRDKTHILHGKLFGIVMALGIGRDDKHVYKIEWNTCIPRYNQDPWWSGLYLEAL